MALSREQILAADDLKRAEVYVEAWGGSIFLKQLTLSEAESIHGDKDESAAKILAMMAVDEDGKRIFTEADIAALREKNAEVMKVVILEALKLNAVDKDAVKVAVKN